MKLILLLLLILISSPCLAATKEEMIRNLDTNKDAIEVNKAIIDMFPDDTEWMLTINSSGYLVVVPMTGEAYEAYQTLFRAKMILQYIEKYRGE